MGFWDEAKRWARGESRPVVQRAYMPGEAGIHLQDEVWGVDTRDYVPEEYAEYATASGPVGSILLRKAEYISMLPLQTMRKKPMAEPYVGDGRSLARVGDLDAEEKLRQILQHLTPLGIPAGPDHVKSEPQVRQELLQLAATHDAVERRKLMRALKLEEVHRDPVRTLIDYVNPHWSFNRLIRMISISLNMYGQAVLFVERGPSGLGTPQEIWWADPRRVRPIPHEKDYLAGYYYEPLDGGEDLMFSVNETVRIYYPHPNNEWQPMSPLALARIYADHEQASMAGNMRFHQQGLHLGALVSPKKGTGVIWTKEQAQKVEDDINRRMRGVDRAHRWGVFRHEIDLHMMGLSPREAEFLGGMEYDLESIARAFGWPVDLISGKRTYQNVDGALKQAWTTVTAEAAFIAAELTEQLLPMFPRKSTQILSFDSSRIAVLQDSEAERWDREKTQVGKVKTVNEWRVENGYPTVEGGDRLYQPANMIPIDMIEEYLAQASGAGGEPPDNMGEPIEMGEQE